MKIPSVYFFLPLTERPPLYRNCRRGMFTGGEGEPGPCGICNIPERELGDARLPQGRPPLSPRLVLLQPGSQGVPASLKASGGGVPANDLW